MYWKYKNITRRRQLRAARRQGSGVMYEVHTEPFRHVGSRGRYSRRQLAWLLLVGSVIAISVVQNELTAGSVVLLLDVAIIGAAYWTWSRLTC
jgi:hypothetical protein